jgi:hypothetical protein
MNDQTPSPLSVVVRRADLEEVRDLLMERIYGSAARSPGHNARLAVEAMLAAAHTPSSLAGGEVLKALLDYIDIQTCTHESIKRGGAIWTICEDCGRKWADDEGGFKPHVDAPAVAAAREYLAALSPEAPARDGPMDKFDAYLVEALDRQKWSGVASTLFRLTKSQADRLRATLTPRHEAPASEGERFTAEQAWADLLEKADRNSPEDSPMLLITWEEMADYMDRAQSDACHEAPAELLSNPQELAPAEDPVPAEWTGQGTDDDFFTPAKTAFSKEAPAEGAGEREAFEAWYCADAAVSGLNMTPKEISRLRDGDGYGKHRHTLNGKWEGWQARARSSAPEGEEALGNLLAVIHGDGGHRALEVGTKQAALEAEKIVAGLFAAPSADKLRTALSEIRDGMVAWRDCISVDDWIELADEALSTPDALKGDAK